MSKYKLINDPVHGFITVSNPIVFQIIEHPFFQRLRRISQMGLANYVYPGTQHTRFHHALGAMHLMQKAISVLRKKGIKISTEEENATLSAILLHDVGHGPYSHALEFVMTEGINHEFFSALMMQQLNKEFDGKLSLAIQIFNGEYEKQFLHELVSSQLDVDRLDYLARDSFFSGVNEGKLSTERIISMLNVVDNRLVVEEKGLYSIEKYIISRRLMYLQVYLHKTAIVAEQLIVQAIKRAKQLASKNQLQLSSKPLRHFLFQSISKEDFSTNSEHLYQYSCLDDFDVMFSVKEWQNSTDELLSYLCKCIVQRKLFKIKLQAEPFSAQKIDSVRNKVATQFDIASDELNYLVLHGEINHLAYSAGDDGIRILKKSGKVKDLAEISEQIQGSALLKDVKKFYVAYPKMKSKK